MFYFLEFKMSKLYFYYSAMNAGKSTILLQSNYNYIEQGMSTVLFTPSIDNRYGAGKIQSRIGISANAISFDDKYDFYDNVKSLIKTIKNLKCVLVDEAQFLTKKQVISLTNIVDNLDIPVIAYGLRSDFRGEPFQGSLYLLAWADNLTEVKTICQCGKKATMNIRIDENKKPVTIGDQVVIGGNDTYISACRKHFKNKNYD